MGNISKLFTVSVLSMIVVGCSTSESTESELEGTAQVVELFATGLDDSQEPVGTVELLESEAGLSIAVDLKNLAPGEHGFHIHENPACGPAEKDGALVAGLAAGGHFDPEQTNKHEGPHGDGHLGDLPHLTVTSDGTLTTTVVAPRIKSLDQIKNRSLMVHALGDNYSDVPQSLGGGGARVACGIIN